MKLEPIFNPHARIGQIAKKTKSEEKDDLINTTKATVLEKYAKKNAAKKQATVQNTSGTGQNFQKTDNFQLAEKVDGESVGRQLLQEGYMQAFIDFFYLTSGTTPMYIQPSDELVQEYKLKKKEKKKLENTKEALTGLRDNLVAGEDLLREGDIVKAFKTYQRVADQFKGYEDYETASYFHKRCLDISQEFKYLEGEARAFHGLGIAEKMVRNKFEAMGHLETSLEKASEDPKLEKIVKEISKDLVDVYKAIAVEHQQNGDFQEALNFFEKCLDVSRKAQNEDMEAECYQQIGLIYDQQEDYEHSIQYSEKFLNLAEKRENPNHSDEEKRINIEMQIKAHKQLAETFVKRPESVSQAIIHLEKVLTISRQTEQQRNHQAMAEAAQKLGLLYNMESKDQNFKKSLEFLTQYFDMLRSEEANENKKDLMKRIDAARVNIGIVEANQKMQTYKYLVLNNLQGLVEWKVKRDPKHFQ